MLIDYLVIYAFSFVGTPYKFGGNSPLDGGMDCSGFVQEILKAGGILPNHVDLSAQQIYDKLNGVQSSGLGPDLGDPKAGAVSFYGLDTSHIDHVGFLINEGFMLSAAGGDASTITAEDAMMSEAFIKLRPINYRGDLVAVIMPNYRP